MCGISAVYMLNTDKPSPRATMLVNMMLARLQNRGDLSTGIARYNPQSAKLLDVRKGRGKVVEFFGEQGSYRNRSFLESFSSLAAIGHNRYATSGQNTQDDNVENYAQPFLREHNRRWKEMAFGFNGNIANAEALRAQLTKRGNNYHFKTDTDTEMIKVYLMVELSQLNKQPTLEDFHKIWFKFSRQFDGAYCITYLDANGNFLAIRDPYGFRPMFYTTQDDMLIVSSEDSAIRALGISDISEVKPGYFLWSDGKKIVEKEFSASQRKAHCIFEYVYFMNAASTFAGRSVQKSRGALGLRLAQNETLPLNDKTVTAPVPGTAIGMCDGYQQGIHKRENRFLPRYDALIKVSESRSFIADYAYNTRDQVIRNKFDLTPGYLEGKELILIDDSVVRGSTSKKLIRYLRDETKATKVHMRSAGAPIRFPCFYGINMPTLEELIASGGKSEKQVGKEIGADSMAYNSIDDMVEAVAGSTGLRKEDFCLGCFTGKYPTKGGNEALKRIQKEHSAENSDHQARSKKPRVKPE